MIEKLKNLINPRAWIDGVIFRKVFQKGIKGAVGVILGLASSPVFSDNVQPVINKVLTAFDISLTREGVENGLTVLVAASFAALWNWAAHGPLKKMDLPDCKEEHIK